MKQISVGNLSKSEIIRLVDSGIIKSMILLDNITMSKTDLPDYTQFENLRGNAISQSEAARRYDIPQPYISRWVKRGIIKRVGMDKNRVLVDEQDVAYCAHIWKHNQGQGKWVFDNDGTPYEKRSC